MCVATENYRRTALIVNMTILVITQKSKRQVTKQQLCPGMVRLGCTDSIFRWRQSHADA